MPKPTVQSMYGRQFTILEGDGLRSLCEGAIEAGGGALATNTAMMCRPFCASGAGNPIISAHRTPIPGLRVGRGLVRISGLHVGGGVPPRARLLRLGPLLHRRRGRRREEAGGPGRLRSALPRCDPGPAPEAARPRHAAVQQILHQSQPAAASHARRQGRGVLDRAGDDRRLRPLRRAVLHGGRACIRISAPRSSAST